MPREMVTLQVGQCGNQLGARFWEMALREHEARRGPGAGSAGPTFDDAMSSFFRNVRASAPGAEEELELGVGSRVERLRARAVLVDMEEGVVMREVMRGRVRGLFDTRQLLVDASGSGNNWAHGHELYASKYESELMESVRRAVEPCESLQGFFMLHSLGGGTGSGLGSAMLEQLRDHYPQVYRFACSVFPSEDDDVGTSPYNAMLSCATLMEAADCVLPIENQALMDICAAAERGKGGAPALPGKGGAPPFAAMNGIAADMLLHLTSSVRFEGSLNTDLNEIIMNLVPFPWQHFLVSSMAPLAPAAPRPGAPAAAAPRGFDPMMSSLFAREHQLIKADPRNSTFIACGLFVRGAATVSDLGRTIRRLKSQLRFVDWNPDGFKVGLCAVPPVGVPTSALALSNSCCIRQTFRAMRARFSKLYRRRVYLHHYLQYMDEARFAEADEAVRALIGGYEEVDRRGTAAAGAGLGAVGRLTPVGTSFAL